MKSTFYNGWGKLILQMTFATEFQDSITIEQMHL